MPQILMRIMEDYASEAAGTEKLRQSGGGIRREHKVFADEKSVEAGGAET